MEVRTGFVRQKVQCAILRFGQASFSTPVLKFLRMEKNKHAALSLGTMLYLYRPFLLSSISPRAGVVGNNNSIYPNETSLMIWPEEECLDSYLLLPYSSVFTRQVKQKEVSPPILIFLICPQKMKIFNLLYQELSSTYPIKQKIILFKTLKFTLLEVCIRPFTYDHSVFLLRIARMGRKRRRGCDGYALIKKKAQVGFASILIFSSSLHSNHSTFFP